MQMQADLAGIPVIRSRVTEVTALGAAALAGLDIGELEVDRTFEPHMSESERAAKIDAWRRAVESAKTR
jgi:glycerol kinase